MVRVKLVDEAEKQKKQDAGTSEQALRIGASQQQQKSVKCFYCGKLGHRKQICRLFLEEKSSDEKNKKKKANEKAKTVRENDPESFTFMVRSGTVDASAWLIDSGATSHLANDANLFVRLDKSVCPVIPRRTGIFFARKALGTVPSSA